MSNMQPSPLESHRKRLARLISVGLPAAGITAGLFFAMQNLIAVDDFEAPELRVYDVHPYAEQKQPPEPTPPIPKLIRQDPILSPPSPPKLTISIDAPDVPIGTYDGAAPADYGDAILNGLRPTGIGMTVDRTLQPITPPVPTYPAGAIRQGLDGYCEVHLKVSPRGDPFDVYAECSAPMFENAAKRSIEKVRFAPQIRNGMPVTVTGVVFPLEFRVKR